MCRAILISIGILFIWGLVIAALPKDPPPAFVMIMPLTTAIWAGIDSYRIGVQEGKTPFTKYNAFLTFLFVLLLWIIGFPWYLSMRRKTLMGPVEQRDKDKEETTRSISTMENNYDETLAQLKKLGELKEKGIITDEEFRAQKEKLLSS